MNDILSCQPNQMFEPVPKEITDPFIFYPPCIRVNRCDGCCNTDVMECVALKNSSHFIDVYKIPSDGEEKCSCET